MLYQIFSLLLDVAVGLVAGAALLRLYMQHQRIPMSARAGNLLGHFVFALTDWCVLPLRRVVPAVGRWDTASGMVVFLLELVQVGVLWLLGGGTERWGGAAMLPLLAMFGTLRLILSAIMALVIVHAVLSWVQTQSPVAEVLGRLCTPMLKPFRRLLPLVGGLDLSPLGLLLAVQVGSIVLDGIQRNVMR